MSSYESNVSVLAETGTNNLILVLDGQEFVIDQDSAGDFLNAVYDACELIGAIEYLHKKDLH